MTHGRVITWLLIAVATFVGHGAFAATVDFEAVAVGTKYGASYGHAPGDVVLGQDGIAMSVEEFFLGTFTGFIKAEVGGPYAQSFPTTALDLDNISVRFDFAGVGFEVTMVTVEYMEFGGGNNFAVNDYTIHEISPMTNLPTAVAPGVTATVDAGVITLVGDIDDFQIGGQELAIDNVIAVPEPTGILLLGLGGTLLLRRRSRCPA